MKVAVLSVALLFTILLCTPEDAQAFLEASGSNILETGYNLRRVKRAEPPVADQVVELVRQRRVAAAVNA